MYHNLDVSLWWVEVQNFLSRVEQIRILESGMRAGVAENIPGQGIQALSREQQQALSEIVSTLQGSLVQLADVGFTISPP